MTEQIIQLPPATQADENTRVDKFLSQKTHLSRVQITRLLSEGQIQPPAKAKDKVHIGDTFTIRVPEAQPETRAKPQNIPLKIVYEDSDLLVINKPAGMVVHPGAGVHEGTLVNALLAHCKDSLSGIGGIQRPGIVHRIDKDTSGLLVVAKNDATHQHLAEQLAKHTMTRTYQAVVYGLCPSSGSVEGNIGRSPHNRQMMAIVPKGKPAKTHYHLLKPLFNGKACLIECKLETGRTHQIRVHMTSIKHPLVGDSTYGHAPKGTPDILKLFPRQALHAATLGFIHPRTGKYMEWSAPLPKDMTLLIQASDVW